MLYSKNMYLYSYEVLYLSVDFSTCWFFAYEILACTHISNVKGMKIHQLSQGYHKFMLFNFINFLKSYHSWICPPYYRFFFSVIKLVDNFKEHISHDKLCDSTHEKVINSELATWNISTPALQDGRRCLSMQERSTKSHNFPDLKRDWGAPKKHNRAIIEKVLIYWLEDGVRVGNLYFLVFLHLR